MPIQPTLRQIKAVIAVCEEGSFTRAAARENATQSGLSQHVAAVEAALGAPLFERNAGGVTPTAAGLVYYRRCVEAVGLIEAAARDVRSPGALSGRLRIGLMPTFTRAALAPTLQDFVATYPEVQLHVVEAYSGFLTDQVLADQLDFAIVPAFEGRVGLKSRMLMRDREMLIAGPSCGRMPLAPVRLADCAPLKIVVPGPDNIRRRNLDIYFETHGVRIERRIEMDAMMATFDLVARSDFVTVLPGLICVNDIDAGRLVINPIIDPLLYSEFVVLTPARRAPTAAAQLFLERFEADLTGTAGQLAARLKDGPGGRSKRRTTREPKTRRAPHRP